LQCVNEGHNVESIFSIIFLRDPGAISLRYLNSIVSLLRRPVDDPHYRRYLEGPETHTRGRNLLLSETNGNYFMSIISRQQGLRVPVLHRRYLNTVPETQNNPFREISLSTAYRTLSRANWTTRVPERQHVYVDYEGRVQFLRFIAPFPVERLINWDAMNNSPTSSQNTRAWGPRVRNSCSFTAI
jgi:hypothetical protein